MNTVCSPHWSSTQPSPLSCLQHSQKDDKFLKLFSLPGFLPKVQWQQTLPQESWRYFGVNVFWNTHILMLAPWQNLVQWFMMGILFVCFLNCWCSLQIEEKKISRLDFTSRKAASMRVGQVKFFQVFKQRPTNHSIFALENSFSHLFCSQMSFLFSPLYSWHVILPHICFSALNIRLKVFRFRIEQHEAQVFTQCLEHQSLRSEW